MKRTRESWFGPKSYVGWGWRPLTWQGWLVTLGFVILVIGALRISPGTRVLDVVAALLVFCLVVLLTGDPPGGPRS